MCVNRRPQRDGLLGATLYVAAHVSEGGEYTDPTTYDTGGVLAVELRAADGSFFGPAAQPAQAETGRCAHAAMLLGWRLPDGVVLGCTNRPSNPVLGTFGMAGGTYSDNADSLSDAALPSKTVLVSTFVRGAHGHPDGDGQCPREIAAHKLTFCDGSSSLGTTAEHRPWGLCKAQRASDGATILYATSHASHANEGAVLCWEPDLGWRTLFVGLKEPNYILAL
eukprot:SAG31_NODE_7181_length_1763_cov_1.400240_1_plen_223_part_00